MNPYQKIYELFLKDSSRIGIDETGDNPIVLSLTSYPARMRELHYCLVSLLTQNCKPGKIILWLGKENFPRREAEIPEEVLALRNKGLEIRWTKDIKSYKKLIPALEIFTNSIIVTADDDAFYPPDWLETLYNDYLRMNCRAMIYAHRAHRITFLNTHTVNPYLLWRRGSENPPGESFLNFATGLGGILYPPGSLHQDILDEQLYSRLCPTADDIFFWAMALLQGSPIRVVENKIAELPNINGANSENALYKVNLTGGQNDVQLSNIFTHYPQLADILQTAQEPSDVFSVELARNFFNSGEYWENRYKIGGNSGAGSYRHLMRFKADTINAFLKEKDVQSVIDFGVGDGNQLASFDVKTYYGFDVSHSVLEKLRKQFSDHKDKHFLHTSEYNQHMAEVALSLDVIYHLIEDDVFHQYMERLFSSAERYVIIYSSNEDNLGNNPTALHVRHRKFTRWINRFRKDWRCGAYIENKYPVLSSANSQVDHSFCNFYIYEKSGGE